MLKNEKGITLIEVLAATVILSMVVILFVNVSGFTLLSGAKDDARSGAIRLAEQITNERRALYLNTVPVASAWTDVVNPSMTFDGRVYQVRIQQTDPAAPVYSGITGNNHVSTQTIVLFKKSGTDAALIPRLVTVTVSWGG